MCLVDERIALRCLPQSHDNSTRIQTHRCFNELKLFFFSPVLIHRSSHLFDISFSEKTTRIIYKCRKSLTQTHTHTECIYLLSHLTLFSLSLSLSLFLHSLKYSVLIYIKWEMEENNWSIFLFAHIHFDFCFLISFWKYITWNSFDEISSPRNIFIPMHMHLNWNTRKFNVISN